MTIDQLAEMRRGWVEASRANGFEEGIKNLLSDLYPDNAHFIYELLQNAEDAKASEVQFILNDCSVEFEHNGPRLFSPKDVEAITSIGSSPKRDDPTNIGKFGIGFKAVFAYTSTPEIESGEYHFHIRDLVVPDTRGLSPASLVERKTRFVFPFDNPSKPPQKAREEIEKNLRELDESALLFLSNIQTIKYHSSDSSESGYLELKERDTDANRIEILVKRPEGIAPRSTYYLRFTKVVTVEDADEVKHCRIAVAFGMNEQGDRTWKITPLDQGKVCIYFPAAKETSNLLFHLHAPFASTVARDSVRDDPANDELVNHLADLVAESMSTIRDQGLLNVEFLALLPNNEDSLLSLYLPIQERLIEAFNREHLTPTKQGNHAPALKLYRGSPQLIRLIDDSDLAILLGRDSLMALWVANPQLPPPRDERGRFVQDPDAQQQNERVHKFLNLLEINEWTTEDFIDVLETESEQVMGWLREKMDDWHEKLYVFLGEFLSTTSSSYYRHDHTRRLSNLRIVRCSDGIYRVGRECHFPGDDIDDSEDLLSVGTASEEEGQPQTQAEDEYEEDFHYVAEGVYSSGQNKDWPEKAREFLKTIGVCEVDEVEWIKVILKQRYTQNTSGLIRPREADLERFIKLVEADSAKAKLFTSYPILQIDKDLDNNRSWASPKKIFLDSPYLGTGLKTYFDAIDEVSDDRKWPLSLKYKDSGIDLARLTKFVEAVGVQTKLQPTEQSIPREHPEYQDFVENALGQWRSDTGTNKDYTISEFKVLIENPTIEKSRLIWRTMCSLSVHYLKAVYQSNLSYSPHTRLASLVHDLRKAKWVPQKDGGSTSFVCPSDATNENLPEGFQYDTVQEWLVAVEFGNTTRKQEAENQRAQEIGFDSSNDAEEWANLAQYLKENGISVDDVKSTYGFKNTKTNPEFPESPVKNPDNRAAKIDEELENSPVKDFEPRERSVRITAQIKVARARLKSEYTDNNEQMNCQICWKEMPFKKPDGEYYFEAVEALPIEHFTREHEAQFLALCPECAARYKVFIKEDKIAMQKMINQLMASEEPQIPLSLGELNPYLHFREKHWRDIKQILKKSSRDTFRQ